MPRVARDADAPEISQKLGDFLGVVVPEENTKRRIAASNIVTNIEPGVGYCQMKMRKEEAAAKVEALFPRGTSIMTLKPILGGCALQSYQWFLDGGMSRRKARRVLIWASFFGAVDARGNPDQGESECKAWEPQWPGSRVVPPSTRGDLWRIELRMGDAVDEMARTPTRGGLL